MIGRLVAITSTAFLALSACTDSDGAQVDGGHLESEAGTDATSDTGGFAADAADVIADVIDARPADGAVPTCAAYCRAMTACFGDSLQYFNNDDCMTICAAFPPGTLGASSGDSLGCRTTEANLAAVDPTTHCSAAGLTGDGVCGTDRCAAFCEVDLAICQGTNAAYAGMSACMTACAGYPYTRGLTLNADTAKNTLNCRLWHLTLAANAATDATTHCPHTSKTNDTCKL